MFTEGQRVRLKVEGNTRLDGAEAVVVSVTEWGAYVDCPAAATGRFRALHAEMVPKRRGGASEAREQGYTGGMCDLCGSVRVRHSGSCQTCDDCGTTSGCG